jgi:hypothetical protein
VAGDRHEPESSNAVGAAAGGIDQRLHCGRDPAGQRELDGLVVGVEEQQEAGIADRLTATVASRSSR